MTPDDDAPVFDADSDSVDAGTTRTADAISAHGVGVSCTAADALTLTSSPGASVGRCRRRWQRTR